MNYLRALFIIFFIVSHYAKASTYEFSFRNNLGLGEVMKLNVTKDRVNLSGKDLTLSEIVVHQNNIIAIESSSKKMKSNRDSCSQGTFTLKVDKILHQGCMEDALFKEIRHAFKDMYKRRLPRAD